MQISDFVRGTEIEIRDGIDTDGEVEIVATSDKGDNVWFYMNEEQARDVVRHLNRVFDMGLRG